VTEVRSDDLHTLPKDLPVPSDDGAARHLAHMMVPPIALTSTRGREVVLADESQQARVVVYAYPRTGAFRDLHAELSRLGARVYGLSTQTTEYQREMAERLHLPFEVLSDAGLRFQRALKLPTFEVAGMMLLKRLTLVLSRGEVEHVLYPVFPPDQSARQVLDWLRAKV